MYVEILARLAPRPFPGYNTEPPLKLPSACMQVFPGGVTIVSKSALIAVRRLTDDL